MMMVVTNVRWVNEPMDGQMASKADHDEVTRALSSIDNKLRKVGIVIPALQEELSNKIENKDLTK